MVIKHQTLSSELQTRSNTPEGAIFNFYDELNKLLGRGHISLSSSVLTNMDFPEGFKRTQTESLNLQRSLQSAIVNASTRGGESNMGLLNNWCKQNQGKMKSLKAYWNIG